jgi:hypothetical protein
MKPDRMLSLEKYRGLANSYDRLVRAAANVRRDAVRLLDLKPGDVVLVSTLVLRCWRRRGSASKTADGRTSC